MRAESRIATPLASRFLFKLCKHFAKKVPVDFDERRGRVEFPFGVCEMAASETTLHFVCESDDAEAHARLRSVIEEHLALMTRQAPLEVVWVLRRDDAEHCS